MFNTNCYGNESIPSYTQDVETPWSAHTTHNSQGIFHQHSVAGNGNAFVGYGLGQVQSKELDLAGVVGMKETTGAASTPAPSNAWHHRHQMRYSTAAATATRGFLPYPLSHYDSQSVDTSHLTHGTHHQPFWVANPNAYSLMGSSYQRDHNTYAERTHSSRSAATLRHNTAMPNRNYTVEDQSRNVNATLQQQPAQVLSQHCQRQSRQQMHQLQQHQQLQHQQDYLRNQMSQREREPCQYTTGTYHQEGMRGGVDPTLYHDQHLIPSTQQHHQQYQASQEALRKASENERRTAFTSRQAWPQTWPKSAYVPFETPQTFLSNHRATGSAFQPCAKQTDSDPYSMDSIWAKSAVPTPSSHVAHTNHTIPATNNHMPLTTQPWLHDTTSHLKANVYRPPQDVNQVTNVPSNFSTNVLNLDTGQVELSMSVVPPELSLYPQAVSQTQRHRTPTSHPAAVSVQPPTRSSLPAPPVPVNHMKPVVKEVPPKPVEPSKPSSTARAAGLDVRQFLATWDEDLDLATPRPAIVEVDEPEPEPPEHTPTSLVVLDYQNVPSEEAAGLLQMYPGLQLSGNDPVVLLDNTPASGKSNLDFVLSRAVPTTAISASVSTMASNVQVSQSSAINIVQSPGTASATSEKPISIQEASSRDANKSTNVGENLVDLCSHPRSQEPTTPASCESDSERGKKSSLRLFRKRKAVSAESDGSNQCSELSDEVPAKATKSDDQYNSLSNWFGNDSMDAIDGPIRTPVSVSSAAYDSAAQSPVDYKDSGTKSVEAPNTESATVSVITMNHQGKEKTGMSMPDFSDGGLFESADPESCKGWGTQETDETEQERSIMQNESCGFTSRPCEKPEKETSVDRSLGESHVTPVTASAAELENDALKPCEPDEHCSKKSQEVSDDADQIACDNVESDRETSEKIDDEPCDESDWGNTDTLGEKSNQQADMKNEEPRDVAYREFCDLIDRELRNLADQETHDDVDQEPQDLTYPVPREISVGQLLDIGDRKPQNISTGEPHDIAGQESCNVSDQELRNDSVPKPSDTFNLEPGDISDTEYRDVSGPEPRDISDPEPCDMSDPKPRDVSDPEPRDVSDPEPQDVFDPEPQDVFDPEPQDVSDPEPQDVSDPEPQDISGRESFDVTDPEPCDLSGWNPSNFSEGEPHDLTVQQPSNTANWEPMEISDPENQVPSTNRIIEDVMNISQDRRVSSECTDEHLGNNIEEVTHVFTPKPDAEPCMEPVQGRPDSKSPERQECKNEEMPVSVSVSPRSAPKDLQETTKYLSRIVGSAPGKIPKILLSRLKDVRDKTRRKNGVRKLPSIRLRRVRSGTPLSGDEQPEYECRDKEDLSAETQEPRDDEPKTDCLVGVSIDSDIRSFERRNSMESAQSRSHNASPVSGKTLILGHTEVSPDASSKIKSPKETQASPQQERPEETKASPKRKSPEETEASPIRIGPEETEASPERKSTEEAEASPKRKSLEETEASPKRKSQEETEALSKRQSPERTDASPKRESPEETEALPIRKSLEETGASLKRRSPEGTEASPNRKSTEETEASSERKDPEETKAAPETKGPEDIQAAPTRRSSEEAEVPGLSPPNEDAGAVSCTSSGKESPAMMHSSEPSSVELRPYEEGETDSRPAVPVSPFEQKMSSGQLFRNKSPDGADRPNEEFARRYAVPFRYFNEPRAGCASPRYFEKDFISEDLVIGSDGLKLKSPPVRTRSPPTDEGSNWEEDTTEAKSEQVVKDTENMSWTDEDTHDSFRETSKQLPTIYKERERKESVYFACSSDAPRFSEPGKDSKQEDSDDDSSSVRSSFESCKDSSELSSRKSSKDRDSSSYDDDSSDSSDKSSVCSSGTSRRSSSSDSDSSESSDSSSEDSSDDERDGKASSDQEGDMTIEESTKPAEETNTYQGELQETCSAEGDIQETRFAEDDILETRSGEDDFQEREDLPESTNGLVVKTPVSESSCAKENVDADGLDGEPVLEKTEALPGTAISDSPAIEPVAKTQIEAVPSNGDATEDASVPSEPQEDVSKTDQRTCPHQDRAADSSSSTESPCLEEAPIPDNGSAHTEKTDSAEFPDRVELIDGTEILVEKDTMLVFADADTGNFLVEGDDGCFQVENGEEFLVVDEEQYNGLCNGTMEVYSDSLKTITVENMDEVEVCEEEVHSSHPDHGDYYCDEINSAPVEEVVENVSCDIGREAVCGSWYEEDIVPVESAQNWRYIEEKEDSPLQVKCSLRWDRILNEGQGLVLGPANVEVIVPGKQPKEHTHWKVVTRERKRAGTSKNRSCVEENNNVMLDLENPIVVFKRLVLKRPRTRRSLRKREQDTVGLWEDTPKITPLKTKAALKAFQAQTDIGHRSRHRSWPAASNDANWRYNLKRRKSEVCPPVPYWSCASPQRLPKVIIKRTGEGPQYQSFICENNEVMQPVVSIERNAELDNLALNMWSEGTSPASSGGESPENGSSNQTKDIEIGTSNKLIDIAEKRKTSKGRKAGQLMKVVQLLQQWRQAEQEEAAKVVDNRLEESCDPIENNNSLLCVDNNADDDKYVCQFHSPESSFSTFSIGSPDGSVTNDTSYDRNGEVETAEETLDLEDKGRDRAVEVQEDSTERYTQEKVQENVNGVIAQEDDVLQDVILEETVVEEIVEDETVVTVKDTPEECIVDDSVQECFVENVVQECIVENAVQECIAQEDILNEDLVGEIVENEGVAEDLQKYNTEAKETIILQEADSLQDSTTQEADNAMQNNVVQESNSALREEIVVQEADSVLQEDVYHEEIQKGVEISSTGKESFEENIEESPQLSRRTSVEEKLGLQLVCQACCFTTTQLEEHANHIRTHSYHCQRCQLAFLSHDAFKDHLAAEHPTIEEIHHCLLCQRTFPTAERYAHHKKGWHHSQMERSQRHTIHSLFRLFTGSECPYLPSLAPDEAKAFDWLPSDPGVIHFYHDATPLQLAVQDCERAKDEAETC